MAAEDGGYDLTLGLVVASTKPVPDSPSLDDRPDPTAAAEDAYRADDASIEQEDWLLDQHSEDVRDQTGHCSPR